MRAPLPKNPRTRQRRNRIAGATVLQLAPPGENPNVPALPKRPERTPQWTAATREWWKSIWLSPMAGEWLPSDFGGLIIIADLRDEYARADNPALMTKLSAEIRLQEQRYGLSPVDRRRLQWEVERGEQAVAKTAKRRQPREASRDPREALTGE